MRALQFLLFLTGIHIAAAVLGDAGSSKADLDRLQGTWLTISLVNDGKTLVEEKSPPQKGPATKLVYDGNKWQVKVGERIVASGGFAIDSTTKPKQIDIFDETGAKNDKTKLGIYMIDGDTYKYCLAPAGKPRPTELSSKEGSGHSLGIMQRERQ